MCVSINGRALKSAGFLCRRFHIGCLVFGFFVSFWFNCFGSFSTALTSSAFGGFFNRLCDSSAFQRFLQALLCRAWWRWLRLPRTEGQVKIRGEDFQSGQHTRGIYAAHAQSDTVVLILNFEDRIVTVSPA